MLTPPDRARVSMQLACALGLLSFGLAQHADLNSPPEGRLTVYIWDHDWCKVFHAGAILRMCEGSSGPEYMRRRKHPVCTYSYNASQVLYQGDTFAVPVVTVGPRAAGGVQISQSVAATQFVGEALGFAGAVTSAPKAVQYMLDMRDFVDGVGIEFRHEPQAPAKFDAMVARGRYVEITVSRRGSTYDGGHFPRRYGQWLSHFERSIASPYFFGAEPSYVDYYLVSMFQWVALKVPPVAKHEALLVEDYPKVLKVLKSLNWDQDATYWKVLYHGI